MKAVLTQIVEIAQQRMGNDSMQRALDNLRAAGVHYEQAGQPGKAKRIARLVEAAQREVA